MLYYCNNHNEAKMQIVSCDAKYYNDVSNLEKLLNIWFMSNYAAIN